jgi:hypothetical protein
MGGAKAREEEIVAMPRLPSLFCPRLLLLLEDARIDRLKCLLFRYIVNRQVGELGELIFHLPHGLEVHSGIVNHNFRLGLRLLFFWAGLQLELLGLLEADLFFVLFGCFGCVGVGLKALNAVEQIFVSSLVLFQYVLNYLDVLLLLPELLGRDVLIGLLDAGDPDQ